jgi:hypothetical protein
MLTQNIPAYGGMLTVSGTLAAGRGKDGKKNMSELSPNMATSEDAGSPAMATSEDVPSPNMATSEDVASPDMATSEDVASPGMATSEDEA